MALIWLRSVLVGLVYFGLVCFVLVCFGLVWFNLVWFCENWVGVVFVKLCRFYFNFNILVWFVLG